MGGTGRGPLVGGGAHRRRRSRATGRGLPAEAGSLRPLAHQPLFSAARSWTMFWRRVVLAGTRVARSGTGSAGWLGGEAFRYRVRRARRARRGAEASVPGSGAAWVPSPIERRPGTDGEGMVP